MSQTSTSEATDLITVGQPVVVSDRIANAQQGG